MGWDNWNKFYDHCQKESLVNMQEQILSCWGANEKRNNPHSTGLVKKQQRNNDI